MSSTRQLPLPSFVAPPAINRGQSHPGTKASASGLSSMQLLGSGQPARSTLQIAEYSYVAGKTRISTNLLSSAQEAVVVPLKLSSCLFIAVASHSFSKPPHALPPEQPRASRTCSMFSRITTAQPANHGTEVANSPVHYARSARETHSDTVEQTFPSFRNLRAVGAMEIRQSLLPCAIPCPTSPVDNCTVHYWEYFSGRKTFPPERSAIHINRSTRTVSFHPFPHNTGYINPGSQKAVFVAQTRLGYIQVLFQLPKVTVRLSNGAPNRPGRGCLPLQLRKVTFKSLLALAVAQGDLSPNKKMRTYLLPLQLRAERAPLWALPASYALDVFATQDGPSASYWIPVARFSKRRPSSDAIPYQTPPKRQRQRQRAERSAVARAINDSSVSLKCGPSASRETLAHRLYHPRPHSL
ncbi:uncharacterized protein EI97DRAFT_438224 [Westerdykella ornata]|uniref:Uncharacterized protein n=1 Tax=Westerdykella ornata TaxID=318751 RepID=A0A6A6JYE9_WESOR|nr:uncharacterized protein EI97DRAFT_438224 [Westerdykella ornata]KAF2280776.1 hypothetical protein EI97DRAFT_438224 [Westerdykella ornata]